MIELTDKDIKNHSQTLFKKLLAGIKQPKVLVIGPSIHPLLDPSVPALAQIVSEKGGEIFIIDIQSSKKGTKTSSFFGDLDVYKKNYHALRNFGVPLPVSNFSVWDAAELMFGKNTFDLILDHCSLLYTIDRYKPEIRRMGAVIDEYLRVLKKGGFCLIMIDKQARCYTEELLEPILKKRPIKFEQKEVTDAYLLKLFRTMHIQHNALYRGSRLITKLGPSFNIGTEECRIFDSGGMDDQNISLIYSLIKYKKEAHLYVAPQYPAVTCYIIRKK